MFNDRREAGLLLAKALEKYEGTEGVVFAIPRGGVVVAKPVSDRLGMPLDLIITRKVGHPANPEYALCVVAEDGDILCNEEEKTGVDKAWLEEAIETQKKEALRRRSVYLPDGHKMTVEGKTGVLVDDGIATGMTFLLAVRELRHLKPRKIVAAIPVMPDEFKVELEKVVDEIVCLNSDIDFRGAVGAYYGDFPQIEDDEVVKLLNS